MFAKIPQAAMTLVGSAVLAAILSWSQSAAAQGDAESPFIGQIIFVGFNFAPKNWATCDGQLLSIAQNTALFSLLGTTYGGNGQTTFALPDMRGRVPMHAGAGHPLGQTGGAETVTLTVQNLPSHNHPATTNVTVNVTAKGNTAAANSPSPQGNVPGNTGPNYTYSTAAPNVDMAPGAVVTNASATTTLDNTGSNQPIDNMKPYTVVNCIIALFGVFPSQN